MAILVSPACCLTVCILDGMMSGMGNSLEQELAPTPLVASMNSVHEMFLAAQDAGFTEDQALNLMAHILSAKEMH